MRMYNKTKYLLLFFVLPAFFSAAGQEVVDTVKFQAKDSALPIPSDPTTDFFQQGEKITAADKVLLVMKNKKTLRLGSFLKAAGMEKSDHVLGDLDGDGKKELLISNYTGGAHCCDELYIFKNTAVNKYQQVAKLFGGHALITRDKEFIYSFSEHFGYFFTCYACAYTDTSDAAPIELRSIALRYTNGKMAIHPGNQELRSTINDNLGKLGELPYTALTDDLAQDDGVRKEIAMNLAVFYYSFGKNIRATQALFNKYYKHPDAKKIWAAFTKQLQQISRESDL